MIPFATYTTAQASNAFQWTGQISKLPHSVGIARPHRIHGSLGWHKSTPKRHLDRFSRFCTAHLSCDQHTDRHQTDTQTTLRATAV